MEMSSIEREELFKSNAHFSSLLQELNKLRLAETFCDITLSIKTETFLAHRNVLAASSPYFKAMLTGGLAEVNRNVILLDGVLPGTFRLLLNFIYTGEIILTQSNCQEVLVAADMFQMTELLEICSSYLQKQLHPSNCIGIFRFADCHCCKNLKMASEAFIHKHFLKVVPEEEFHDAPKDILNVILQSENLYIENEFQVFTAAMRWLLHDASSRRKLVFEIMENVRLPIISHNQIETYAVNCPDLGLKIALMKILKDIKDSIRLPYVLKASKMNPALLFPRKCARRSLYVIGGSSRRVGGRWSDTQTLAVVEKFDSFRQVWKTNLPSLDQPRSGHGVCVLNGLIYVLGGESESLISDSVQAFDPASDQWTDLACLTVPRCSLGVVAVDDHIYAIGGWVGSEIGDTIEMYNSEFNSWSKVDKLPTLRFAMGVVECQGLIYIIGGVSDTGSEIGKVETYNPVTREWNELPPLSTPRAYVGTAVIDDNIYVVGGWNERIGSLNSVEKYSVKDNTWSLLPYMSVARTGACVASVNGLLYVLGGRTSSDAFVAPCTLTSVECYDPHADTWTCGDDMPTSRCEAGVAVL